MYISSFANNVQIGYLNIIEHDLLYLANKNINNKHI